jgi:hypothetical protein
MRAFVLVVIAALCVGCAQDAQRTRAEDQPLALYSWHPRNHTWHFVLLPDRPDRDYSDAELMRSHDILVGVLALKSRLHSLGRGQLIAWRGNTYSHIVAYPPDSIRDDIIRFGKLHGVQISALPTLYW